MRPSSNDVNLAKIQEWKSSTDYYSLCQSFDFEAEDILRYALKDQRPLDKSAIAKTEIGSRSDLHRGFYCPSPVYDIFVGNVHRGRLMKRLSKKSNNYYLYGFDCTGKLICADNYVNNQLVSENIYHTDTGVYGIILDQWGHISHGSREVYDNGKLVSYSRVLFSHNDGMNHLVNLVNECYTYDPEGLYQCIFTQYVPSAKLCQQKLYQFQRRQGKLASYTAATIIGRNSPKVLSVSQEYVVPVDRNA